MKLEERIQASGKMYFAKKVPVIDPLKEIVKTKRKQGSFFHPWVLGGFASLTTALGLFLVFSLTLNTAQSDFSMVREFQGLTNLNTVTFPDPNETVSASSEHLHDFALSSSQVLFSSSNENQVYSPLSLYITLGMLLEASSGSTYEEIKEVLDFEIIDSLRIEMKEIYRSFYQSWFEDNQEVARFRLHQGLFIREDFEVAPSYTDRLAESYFAEVFHTDFSPLALQGMVDWINDRTFDFLNLEPSDLTVTPETVMTLFQTLYMKANWEHIFQPLDNYVGIFNEGFSSEKSNQLFMKKIVKSGPWFNHEDFVLVGDRLIGNQSVYYVVPKDNHQPEEIWQLYGSEIMEFLKQPFNRSNILLHVPKTKIQTTMNLQPMLETLGVQTIFSPEADLSLAAPNLLVSSIQQQAGFLLNEGGLEAAAVTETDFEVVSTPSYDREVRLNRPFMMLTMSDEGLISFMSLVQTLP